MDDESSLLCEFLEGSEGGYLNIIHDILSSVLDHDEANNSETTTEAASAASPKCKRQKFCITTPASASASQMEEDREEEEEEAQKKLTTTSHITVERNRRKQMNHHLSVLRSLMPSFYVKRVSPSSFSSIYVVPSSCIISHN